MCVNKKTNLEKLLSNYLENQELNEEDITKTNLLKVIFLGIRKMVYELLIKTDFDEFLGYEKYKSNNNINIYFIIKSLFSICLHI